MNAALLIAFVVGTRAVTAYGAAVERSTVERSAVERSAVEERAAPEGEAIRVGDTLQATRDVSLDDAIIAEGSKVSVSGKRSSSAGVVLDVALADGHVVKGVPLVEIRKSFRRVANG